MVHDVWVEVDLSALRHNLQQIRSAVAENVAIMAVVKGNGFGHGYVEPARAFLDAGADALAVTRLEEALIIRKAGITTPILLFAPIQPDNAEIAIDADLEMTVASIPLVQAISKAAIKLGQTAKIHVKVDTGMGRLGLSPNDVAGFFEAIESVPGIIVAGIFTHFATAADANIEACREQYRCFDSVLQNLRRSGIDYGKSHAANSAAILRLPETHLDMVRPGTLLYGQYPSQSVPRIDLKPTWQLKARICEIRQISKGLDISYGAEYTTKRNTTTAVIPIGYADGFTLAPEGPVYRQSVIKFLAKKIKRSLNVDINGRKVQVIGRVAMQMAVLDVTNVPDIKVGDEVIVPAMRIPTSPLIPRIYLESFI